MKTRLILLLGLVALMPFLSPAQIMQVGVHGGFASYLGDLQTKQFLINVKDPSLGATLRYEINGHWAVRAGFIHGTVSANDRNNNNPDLQQRNLSFISAINEVNTLLEFSLFDLQRYKITPHLFAGIAGYHFNPYAIDLNGNRIYLRPLKTEGQGLPGYKDRKMYSLYQFAIPMGGGVRIALNNDIVLGLEVGYRRLFTDYLDDVSKSYADPSTLEHYLGLKTVEMAYRGNQVNGYTSTEYPMGRNRGNSRYNDWYTFYHTTLTIPLEVIFNVGSQRGHYLESPRNIY